MRCARHFRCLARTSTCRLILVVFAVYGTVAAQTLPKGPFGFVINSTFSDPATQGGSAILGLMNFDGSGKVSGSYTFELGAGGSGEEQTIIGSITGTYSSNPNGTGTISIALINAEVNLTFAIVIDNSDLQLVVTDCVGSLCNLGGSVMSGVGNAGSTKPVTQRSLNGSYGVQTTKSSPTPQTTVGGWTFDGAGNVFKSETFVTPGPTVGSGTLLGTYSVNSDGTGTLNFPPQSGSLMGQTFVFVTKNSQSGLLILQTNRSGDGVEYGMGDLQATAQATVSPIAVTFAPQKVGTTSVAHKVTLKNNLSTVLAVYPYTFTGADAGDFSVSTSTCGTSLAAKSTCTISVVFKPTATGTRTATLNVNDSANNGPQTVSLTGTGQ